jgi:hypothetical protein
MAQQFPAPGLHSQCFCLGLRTDEKHFCSNRPCGERPTSKPLLANKGRDAQRKQGTTETSTCWTDGGLLGKSEPPVENFRRDGGRREPVALKRSIGRSLRPG